MQRNGNRTTHETFHIVQLLAEVKNFPADLCKFSLVGSFSEIKLNYELKSRNSRY